MGGAIFNAGGMLTITNSTVSGNAATGGANRQGTASGMGAGMFSRNGSVTSVNSTFANNTVTNGNASGGAIFLVADGAGAADGMGTGITTQIDNTIFADSNGGSDAAFVSLNGGISTFSSLANLLDTNDGTNPLGINLIASNTDPQLSPLADNGGPTQTHAIVATSPALNAGYDPAATNAGLTTDQRGLTRISAGQVDVGAFELQAETPRLIVTTNSDTVNAFDGLTSLREAIQFSNSQPSFDSITFANGSG